MMIKAFDGSLYCCVNDKEILALEEIPEHEAKSKDLDPDYKKPKPTKRYIPPVYSSWRRSMFRMFVRKQPHHYEDDYEMIYA